VNTATRVSHSIICCRILLNLKQAATPENTSTGVSTGLAFRTSPGEQTNQAETVQLEARGSWDDEGNQEGGMAGTSSQNRNRPVGEVE
jgi:hypothetical protein